jgi:uncharacterized protein YjbI with pentapeptide repeats
MADNNDPRETSLSRFIEGTLSPSEIGSYFHERSDLTYKTFRNLNVSGAHAYRSLFTGSLFQNCQFDSAVFSRSDLDGIRAEITSFAKCDFTTCDIRSSHFSGCTFQECKFNNTFIDDCFYDECKFVECTFNGASLTNCRFQNSLLRKCPLTEATFLHNRMQKTRISEMVLGNCTILYSILADCTLINVTINAESIGALLGLTRAQLEQSKIIYLGQLQVVPADSDIVRLLAEEYSRRKWSIEQLVVNLNFDLASVLGSFDQYLSDRYARFVENGFVKGDEIRFLTDILVELASHDRLPLLTALDVLEWCGRLEVALSQKSNSTADSIVALASRCILLINSMVDKVSAELLWPAPDQFDAPVYLRVIFNKKPELALTETLNSIKQVSLLPIAKPSSLLDAQLGSYIEVVNTSIYTVFAFRLFLFVLNGCVIQATELKARINVFKKRRAPKSYTELAMGLRQQPLLSMVEELKNLSQYAKQLNITQSPSLGGYDASNIQTLEVSDVKEDFTNS